MESVEASAQGSPQLPQMPQTLQAALGSHYALEREVGRGGMATVYLARDLRHRRLVAVKVLHPELSAMLGPERFLREIEVTAALQHPHVLPLFDSGAAGGLLYYVMPYVEGESLRQRLERERQLPVGEALRFAREVADALSYAHDRGVVHRDIKPENILLQGARGGADTHALVADFGIALAVEQAGGARMTQTGLSLGTPQYMAPEQALGEKTVDARADVYALGAVTYEMLVGEPPFTGPTAQAIIARMVTEEPRSLTAQRASVPSYVDAAVRTALAKLPADRFRSAGAFGAALASPAAVNVPLPLDVTRGRMRRFPRPVLAASTLAATAILAWVLGRASSVLSASSASHASYSPGGPVRFVIGADSAVERFSELAVSPDGRTVVYSGDGPEGGQLYVRRLDEIEARPLAGTEDADWPFFSPDGAWVAFFSHAALRKVRLDGGAPVVVTPIRSASFGGGSWGEDGTILYALAPGGGALYRVPADGGVASRVRVADTTVALMHPFWLPGDRAALVSATGNFNTDARIGVLDLATGRLRAFAAGIGPQLVGGDLLYAAGGVLYRQPFDLARREPTDPAVEVARGLETFYVDESAWWIPRPAYGASATGTLVYRVGGLGDWIGDTKLVVSDRAGREQQVIPARAPWSPRLSPDGRRVVYAARAPGQDVEDIWVTDLGTRATERVTSDGGHNDPVWRPDGKAVAYVSRAPGGSDMFVQALDGGGAQLLLRRPGDQLPNDWSRSDDAVLFTDMAIAGDDAGAQDIWIQPASGGAPRPYLTTAAHERGARVSPDGHWVAYQSDETGRTEVYVQSYPKSGIKAPVSVGGGTGPVWRGDGRELFYWRGNQLIAASLTTGGPGDPLIVRSRAPLFRAPYVGSLRANYDASADGTRFVLVTGRPQANRLVVTLDAPGAQPRRAH